MRKPEGVGEWDGFPMPNVPKDRPPLTKEQEEELLAELHRRTEKRRAESARKQTEGKKAV